MTLCGRFVTSLFCKCVSDKQQDLPEFKVEDVDRSHDQSSLQAKRSRDKNAPLSQISGVRRLKHSNSFTGAVPKYGVETSSEEELGTVGVASCYD